jgi:hypothetical protein
LEELCDAIQVLATVLPQSPTPIRMPNEERSLLLELCSQTTQIPANWEHPPEHVLDMIAVGSGRVVDFEIFQKTTASGHGNYHGSSHGMEVEALKWMVKRWEDNQRMAIVVTDHEQKWRS